MRAASVIARLQISNGLDFNPCALRQLRDLHCGSGRIFSTEILRVDLIHLREVIHIIHKAGRLDDLAQTASGFLQNCFEVREDLSGLRLDITFHQIAGCRIDRDLSRCDDQIADDVGLCVRSDRGRCFFGCYNFSPNNAPFLSPYFFFYI